jgi:hypothetical protein
MTSFFKSSHYCIFAFSMSVLSGCQMEDQTLKVSSDVNAFNNLIDTDVSFKSIKWQLFDTPEYKGGLPAPVDYVTLIAEVDSAADKNFEQRPAQGRIGIAPESARTWLSADFRALLENSKNSGVDIAEQKNCRVFAAVWKRTHKPVHGLICEKGARLLIYVTIADYTPG